MAKVQTKKKAPPLVEDTPEVTAAKAAGGQRGGAAGSRKGIPNKRSTEARQRLEDMEADPLLFLAKTMKNEHATEPHRLVKMIIDIGVEGPNDTDWKMLLTAAHEAVEDFFAFTPFPERQKAASDLMPYMYPKLKQIEVNITDEIVGDPDLLTNEELAAIANGEVPGVAAITKKVDEALDKKSKNAASR